MNVSAYPLKPSCLTNRFMHQTSGRAYLLLSSGDSIHRDDDENTPPPPRSSAVHSLPDFKWRFRLSDTHLVLPTPLPALNLTKKIKALRREEIYPRSPSNLLDSSSSALPSAGTQGGTHTILSLSKACH